MESPKYTLKEASEAIRDRAPDQLLEFIVGSFAESKMGITLIVGGQIYTGVLCTFEDWLTFHQQHGVPETLVDGLREIGAHQEPPERSEDDDFTPFDEDEREEHELARELMQRTSKFLYVRDCQQLTPAGFTRVTGGMTMRFRLSEVCLLYTSPSPRDRG